MGLDIKVLVVDDSSTMRRIVKGVFKGLGFTNILEAEDGSVALEKLKKEEVDLILADWSMPKVTGLDLLKTVRSDNNLKNIPFIMVTAEGQKKDILEAAKARVSNYVVKPFAPETLSERIKKVFKE
jgi:two-component system chemotaxis response regulator CheY